MSHIPSKHGVLTATSGKKGSQGFSPFLTQHIFRKPYPTIGVNVDADANAVQRGAGQMDENPIN
jgi:hypothetical protein